MKKYLRTTIAILLCLCFVAGAAAWYSWQTISTTATVQESLSVTNEVEFSATMYPGETNTWTWNIVNAAPVVYDLKADLTCTAPNGVAITAFVVDSTDKLSDLLDDNSAGFSIAASGTLSCSLTITASKDATPDTVTVTLDFSRA